ncbi:MAG: MoxR family ATPase [Myxococcota bacterium]
MEPKWAGSEDYIASEELRRIVEVAAMLGRPLLVKGEPGTGKTLLARSVAEGLGAPLFTWHVKSTTKAKDGLYVYDTVQRLYDSRFDDKRVDDIRQYISLGPVGQAFASDERAVLLIDEVDKADIEFPNDLLHELDAMGFTIPETGETVQAKQRPIVIITSNSEKELPDAFLRRAIFHYISFPDRALMTDIVHTHHPELPTRLLERALDAFYRLREIEGVRKPPSTSELVDWIGALMAHGVDPESLDQELPFLGVLLKREDDTATTLRRLASSGTPRGR